MAFVKKGKSTVKEVVTEEDGKPIKVAGKKGKRTKEELKDKKDKKDAKEAII